MRLKGRIKWTFFFFFFFLEKKRIIWKKKLCGEKPAPACASGPFCTNSQPWRICRHICRMRGRFNNSVATFVSFKLIHVLVLGVLLKYISLFTCDTTIIFSSFAGGWSWGLACLSLANSSSSCRKMLTHPNARVLRAEERGLTTLPNPLLDGKKAACSLPCRPG